MPGRRARSRSVTALPGRDERQGGLGGHLGAPQSNDIEAPKPTKLTRGAPWLRRGAPNAWGVWGDISGPPSPIAGPPIFIR